MDFDPTAGQLGAPGVSRAASAWTAEQRRPTIAREVPREGPPRSDERDGYSSPGLRPPTDPGVVLTLSPKALALAKSANRNPSLVESTDAESKKSTARRDADAEQDAPQETRSSPRHRIDVRA